MESCDAVQQAKTLITYWPPNKTGHVDIRARVSMCY